MKNVLEQVHKNRKFNALLRQKQIFYTICCWSKHNDSINLELHSQMIATITNDFHLHIIQFVSMENCVQIPPAGVIAFFSNFHATLFVSLSVVASRGGAWGDIFPPVGGSAPPLAPPSEEKNGQNQQFSVIFWIFAPSETYFAPLMPPHKKFSGAATAHYTGLELNKDATGNSPAKWWHHTVVTGSCSVAVHQCSIGFVLWPVWSWFKTGKAWTSRLQGIMTHHFVSKLLCVSNAYACLPQSFACYFPIVRAHNRQCFSHIPSVLLRQFQNLIFHNPNEILNCSVWKSTLLGKITNSFLLNLRARSQIPVLGWTGQALGRYFFLYPFLDLEFFFYFFFTLKIYQNLLFFQMMLWGELNPRPIIITQTTKPLDQRGMSFQKSDFNPW